MKKTALIILLISLRTTSGQACCTAGTPLLGSLEMTTAEAGGLLFGLTYELNVLQDVYDGSEFLNERSRERLSKSLLLEINYGFSDRITLTALISFINQTRTISPLLGTANELSVSGTGDAMILLKYNFLVHDIFNQTEISAGTGFKLPLGSSDIRSNGILLPADMQPGTGSWDGILWAYFSHGFFPSLPLNIFGNLSYRFNGINKRFGENAAGYRFGNELIASGGFGYRTNTIFDFTLMMRYRRQGADEFDRTEISNTGGHWLNVVPGINIVLHESLTARLSGQVPVYRSLSGTQLTTTYTAAISLFYSVSN